MRGTTDRAGGAGWWVALAALAPYLTVFGNAFVRDDLAVIRDNPLVGQASGLWRAFARSWWGTVADAGLYRPLTTATFVANGLVEGTGSTWGFAAVDLGLHAGVSLLVLRLARALGAGPRAALAAALVFAVHPVHVEAVAGFVGRADVLATLFVLAAVCAHRAVARDEVGATRWRAVTAVLLLAGLLSKESAVAAFALLPFIDLIAPARRADGTPMRFRERWRRDLPWLAGAGLVWLALRWLVLGALFVGPGDIGADDNPLVPPYVTPLGDARGVDFLAARASAIALVPTAARLLCWPARLSADYSPHALPVVTDPADARLWFGLAVAVAILALAFRARRRAPLLACSAGWLALAWLPVSNLVLPIGTIFAERLLYLPSVGFALGAGAVWAAIVRSQPRRRRAVAGLGMVILLLAAARTATRNLDWRDSESLWTSAAAAVPASFRPDAMMGIVLMERGDRLSSTGNARAARAAYAQARPRLERALSLFPEHVDANRALAWVEWQLGRPAQAVTEYERLARLVPRDPKVNVDWAAALLADANDRPDNERTRLVSQAEQLLDAASRWRPDSADVHYALGVLKADYLHDREGAVDSFRRALELDPDHPRRAAMRSRIDDHDLIDER